MASSNIPNLFSTEFCQESSSFNNNNNVVPLSNNYDINSPPLYLFPDQQQHLFGGSDCMIVPQMSDIESGFRDFCVNDYNQLHHHQVFEDYGLLPPNFCHTNFNPMPPENWVQGIEGKAVVSKVEESEVKVGRYSVEERKDRILRYLKKRNQRNFNKTIKYACRKTLADKRVRVRGRFAKNNEPSEQDQLITSCNQQNHCMFYKEMKYEEDYWLQAAMDNLVYLPYLSS